MTLTYWHIEGTLNDKIDKLRKRFYFSETLYQSFAEFSDLPTKKGVTFHAYMLFVACMLCQTVRGYLVIGRIRYVWVSECHTSSIQCCQYLLETIETSHFYTLFNPPVSSLPRISKTLLLTMAESYLAFTALWAHFLLHSHDIPFPMILHWPAANWEDIGETLSAVVAYGGGGGGGGESPGFSVLHIILAELLSIIRPDLPWRERCFNFLKINFPICFSAVRSDQIAVFTKCCGCGAVRCVALLVKEIWYLWV